MERDPLALSIIEHFAYCPRQAALIHVEGTWEANADTARGEAAHASVDRAVRKESRSGVETWLSLPVWSTRLNISGICDAVELGGKYPVPVEHKPRFVTRPNSPAVLQLAAQAMCLEEMWGVSVPTGILFTRSDLRRHEIAITSEVREATEYAITACQALLEARDLPPTVNDGRCSRCSLAEVCGRHLPDGDDDAPFVIQHEAAW